MLTKHKLFLKYQFTFDGMLSSYNAIIFSEDLSKLQYLTWCIKESMRRYPPVFMVYRRITQDVEIDGYVIPKGLYCDVD